MAGNGWQVIEADDFERGALQCGGLKQVEEVIAPIKFGLSRDPTGFQETVVSGIWIARTRLRMNGPDIILSHCVWYRIDAPKREVRLLWVEVTKPENMDWPDDWEVPF